SRSRRVWALGIYTSTSSRDDWIPDSTSSTSKRSSTAVRRDYQRKEIRSSRLPRSSDFRDPNPRFRSERSSEFGSMESLVENRTVKYLKIYYGRYFETNLRILRHDARHADE